MNLPRTTNKADVCMLVFDTAASDPVIKEAVSLSAHGWKVLILGINTRNNRLVDYELADQIIIYRAPHPSIKEGIDLALNTLTVWLAKFVPGLGQPPQAGDSKEQGERKRSNRWRISTSLLNTLHSLEKIIARQVFLKRKLQEVRPNVFHAQDFPALHLLGKAGVFGKHRVVYDSHEYFFEQDSADSRYAQLPSKYWNAPKRVSRRRSLQRVEQRLAQRADKIITVSEGIATAFQQRWAVEKPAIIRNVVDLRILEPSNLDYGNEGFFTLVHSGSITYGRQLREFVASLPFLPETVRGVFMGKFTPFADSLLHYAETLGVKERLKIVPPVPQTQVPSALSQADAGVSLITSQAGLSYKFSLPNKLFEYIAAGLPVIASRADDIAALVKEYDVGVICDEQDPESIAEAISTLLDPEKSAHYRKNCGVALKDLNWEKEEKKLLALYTDLLQ